MVRNGLLALFCVFLVVGLQACGLKPTPEESCNFVQNSDMQRVSWGAQVPVILYVDSSVPNQYYTAIQAAADSWNQSVGHTVIKIGGWTNEGAQNLPNGTNVIYFQKDWDGPTTEQARTTIYWSGNRIYEAHVKVNDRDFTFFSGETPVAGSLDFQSLLLHELGHVLGLKHTDVSQSVMVPTLASASSLNLDAGYRRDVSDYDKNSVACEY